MDKNISIILTVNSNLESIQQTLRALKKIEFIDELYVISNSESIKLKNLKYLNGNLQAKLKF